MDTSFTLNEFSPVVVDNGDSLQGITFGKQRRDYKIHAWLKNNLSFLLRRDHARSSLALTRAVHRPARLAAGRRTVRKLTRQLRPLAAQIGGGVVCMPFLALQ
ncbi:TPA: hypothetical protein I8Y16_004040 [Raoultella ornithinolytica]|nr:hypothetical protein [Raoultella ornithinolytica]HAT1670185.1 hypothetical protein [Raoultella ornithinolytica]